MLQLWAFGLHTTPDKNLASGGWLASAACGSMPARRCRLINRAGTNERACWLAGWVAGTDEPASRLCWIWRSPGDGGFVSDSSTLGMCSPEQGAGIQFEDYGIHPAPDIKKPARAGGAGGRVGGPSVVLVCACTYACVCSCVLVCLCAHVLRARGWARCWGEISLFEEAASGRRVSEDFLGSRCRGQLSVLKLSTAGRGSDAGFRMGHHAANWG